MARKVNVKFVIGLSVVLASATGVAVTLRAVQYFRVRNPELVKADGEAAEKAGNLKVAVDKFQRAGDLLAAQHSAGADVLYLRAADLCQKISKTAETADEAVSYYQRTNMLWTSAIRENPRNKELNEMLLELQHVNTLYSPSAPAYLELERLAKGVTAIAPTAKAFTYLAEAKYQKLLSSVTRNLPLDKIDEILKGDVASAEKIDPDFGPVVALRAQLEWKKEQVRLAVANIDPRTPPKDETSEDVKAAWKEAVDVYQHGSKGEEGASRKGGVDAIANRLNSYLAKTMQTDVADVLASIIQEQYEISGKKDDGRRNEIVALLEKAFAADKDNELLELKLANLYIRTNQSEKTETLFKDEIARQPEKPETYFRLGEYYRITGQGEKAIEAYKDVRKHPAIGTGREAYQNREHQIAALERLAWLQMELAGREGVTTTKGQALMKEAADNTDALRKQPVVKGILYMLDGRAQLLNQDTAQAVKTLHRAEETLNNGYLMDRYRQTELLLADASMSERQYGQALELVDKALSISVDLSTIIKKGTLLMQVGRYPQAEKMMGDLLGNSGTKVDDNGNNVKDDQTEGHYQNEALLGKAGTAAADRILVSSRVAQRQTDARAEMRKGAALQLAQLELNDGDNEAALADATSVLANAATNTDQENSIAYQISLLALVRLEKTDDAKKLAAEALAKFPSNSYFQAFSAELAQEGNKGSIKAQEAILNAITDDYARQFAYANFYIQQKKYDESLDALQKAEASLGATPNRDKQQEIVDRSFAVALTAAAESAKNKDLAKRDAYWNTAQKFVTEAEKLNLDGTGGKLYQGRLQMVRTENKEGIKLLEQAIAQRPDYATGRVILGQGYIRVSNLSAALDQFREAVRLAPNNLLALQYAIDLLRRRSDSSSLEEARSYLQTGLSISPYNRTFAMFQDLLTSDDKLQKAIADREAIRKREPNDLDNIRGLAALYVRQASAARNPADKNGFRQKAVDLIKSEFEKKPDDLGLADTLARLYHEMNADAEGIKLYEPFLTHTDPKIRYIAYIAKAEFARRAGDNYTTQAIEAFTEAIKIKPEGNDEAERHLGDMYFDLSRWSDAEAIYSRVSESATDPNARDAVIRRLIEALLREGGDDKIVKAQSLLTDLLKRHKDDKGIEKQGMILQAFAKIQQKNIPSAITDLSAVITADPSNIQALYYRAVAYVGQNKFEEAIRDLMAARSVDRTAVNVRMLLAQLYQQTQRFGEASNEYAETIDLHPELMNIRIAYTDFLLNLAKMEKRFPKESGIEFVDNIRQLRLKDILFVQIQSASERFPIPHWWVVYAQLLALNGEDGLAHNVYSKLSEDPASKQDASVQEAFIGSLLTTKQYQSAVDAASSLIDTNATFIATNPQYVSLYIKRAKAFYALKKEAEGAQDVNRALSVAADVAKAKADYGLYVKVLADTTDPDAAVPMTSAQVVAVLRGRIAANPEEVVARMGLVQMLVLDGKMDDAAAAVKEIQVPPTDVVLKSLVLRERALIESQTKQFEAAKRDFDEILLASPEDIDCLNNYAFMLADGMGKPDDAIKLAQKALLILNTKSTIARVFAATPIIQDTLGWAQYLKGDTEAAITTLRLAIKLQPIPSAYYHLANAYQKKGSIAEAVQTTKDGILLAEAAHDDILPELRKLQEKLNKLYVENK